MAEQELKSAGEWLAIDGYNHITVLDPDGWDRSNYEESWAEKISEEEFQRRLMMSTVMTAV